jgi:hypothetical protein
MTTAMRERELGRYQMLWDCPSCDTPKLLGLNHRHCPNCGAAQDPTRRYYPSDADRVAVEDHRYTGADRLCPACESPAAAAANNCANCGSPLDAAAAVRTRAAQAAGAAGFAADDATTARVELQGRRDAAPLPAASTNPKTRNWTAIGVFVAIVAVVAVFFLWKKDVGLEVSGHTWSRTIAVETLALVSESAWRDGLPADAQAVSCQREQRSTRQVADGETCTKERRDLGDGTFKEVDVCRPKFRAEPVYDERCSYVVPRWRHARDLVARGSGRAPAPRWPEVNLARPGACVGCEREGARTAQYEVELMNRATGTAHTCTFDEGRWARLEVGSTWAAKARVIGGGLDCGSLVAR